MDGRSETALSRGGEKSAAADAVVPDNVRADNPERERTANEHNELSAQGLPDEVWKAAKERYYDHREQLMFLFGVYGPVGKSKHSEGVKKGENQGHAKKT